MVKISKLRLIKKWRSAPSWPSPFNWRRKKPKQQKASSPNWRVKHYALRFSPRRTLLVSARKFKTSNLRRSKKYKQFIIPLYLLPVKELAVRQKLAPKRKPKTYVIVIKPRVVGAYMFIILGLVGVAYFGLQIKSPGKIEPVTTFALPTPAPSADYTKPVVLSRSEPARIRIPKINLDAKIITVGRLADGTMETPSVLDYVTGWYKYSPTPGELGPAIIVGHVDSYKGISVFWRLRELQAGDIVEITRADGSGATFKVNSLQQFDQANFPTQAVYGDINYAGLRLITCGGTFNRQTGHYDHNTVVFATLVN